MHNFRNLIVFQKAKALSLEVYKITESFPKTEMFVLQSQVRRCAVSIFSNIAEGASRESKLDFARFIEIAIGSCNEVEVQLEFAMDLKYINKDQYNFINEKIIEVRKILLALRKKIKS